MFAILRTGGKQYRVSEGNFIDIEKIDIDRDETAKRVDGVDTSNTITFDDVLLICKDDGSVEVGKPVVAGATVRATILKNYRAEKVIIFKKLRRKNHRRKNGHRQRLMRVRIDGIDYRE